MERQAPAQPRIRRRIRENGRPIGWEIVGPSPEPTLPPFLVEDHWGKRVMSHEWIEALYRQARRPAPGPIDAWPAERIDEVRELLQRLETWYGERRTTTP
jgi:hypothetical protein